MTNFINSLENYFQERGLNVEKYSPTAIRHGLDVQTSGKEALFICMNNNGSPMDKGIFVYKKDHEYVILGSGFVNKKRNFKQLLVLTSDQSGNKLLDNTNNEVDIDHVMDALIGWLK